MRIRLLWRPCGAWSRAPWAAARPPAAVCRRWLSTTPGHAEPLRILFCGSDTFSCASLQALHNEMQQQQLEKTDDAFQPGRIASLDVVVRPAKRTGRGFKTIQESPAKILATSLGLCVHERDTFTGWQPPPVNMIIAVSFGLFVPPRILRAARYGGLNVHPSLLPDLRGAAPIEHALLAGRTRTGVTVQTLDDRAFDAGRVLLQGPEGSEGPEGPGLAIPPRCTAPELHSLLAPLGADLLVQTLRRGLYLPGAELPEPLGRDEDSLLLAPKLTKADRQVPWRTAQDIVRRFRALGSLWTHMAARAKKTTTEKRAILEDMDVVPCPDALLSLLREDVRSGNPAGEPCPLPVLTFVQHSVDSSQKTPSTVSLPFVAAADGSDSILLPVGVGVGVDLGMSSADKADPPVCLRIGTIKIEGDRAKAAARAVGTFARNDVPCGEIAWDVALTK